MEPRHPDDGLLLRYADGELPARKARQVKRHLEACWNCRAALEDLERTVGECVRYRKNVLAEHLPAPPSQWQDLTRGFERIDAEQERGPLGARLLRTLFPAPVRWSVAAVAAVLLLAVVGYQWRETPSVRAATLLRKAVAAADAKPKRPRRLRVKTRKGEFTRPVGAARASDGTPVAEALFLSARYDWDDPLSAKAYASWRDGLQEKSDRIAVVPSAGSSEGAYRISTSTSEGELAGASITLRMPDLEPVEGRFEFRGSEWVEISEAVDSQASPASEMAAAAGAIPSAPAAPPPPAPAPPIAAPAAGIGDELRAVAALHRMGADLGDPLQVTRRDGRVLVSGNGIPPERQRQIQEALAALPNVDLRFESSVAPPAPAARQPSPAEPSTPAPASGLQEKLGGRVPFERFSSQLLDRSDAAMARAYALSRMAQQFPPAAEREMSPADRNLLRSMALEHAAALGRAAGEIDSAMSPLLNAHGATPEPRAGAGTWQSAADQTLNAARQMEASLAAVLGMTSAGSGAEAASRYAAAMARMKASLELCQRLLSYDDGRQSR